MGGRVATAAVGHLTLRAATCPEDYINIGDEYRDVCIFIHRPKDKWHAMRASCQDMGLDLATLTGNLHTKVIQYINNHAAEDLKGETFWIGGTDEVLDGNWKWIHDKSEIPLGTPHWYPCNRKQEPDGGTNQNYLCLPHPKFYFQSCDGDDKHMGICQLFPDSL
nr:C-type lectin CTL-4 [Portunus trituberculatus]